ncbi:MAG: DUF4350 domain-containing protein, partial [Natronomonas sp.]
GAGFLAADTPAEPADATVDNEYFTSESLLSDSELAPRSGDISFERQPSRTVLIASDGDPSEIEPVVNALVAHGHDVEFVDRGGSPVIRPTPLGVGVSSSPTPTSDSNTDLAARLDEADAFLVVGDTQFEDEEADSIEAFADAGGRVIVATDRQPAAPFGVASSSDPTSLTSRFGVAVSSGYLFDMHENDANFQRVYAEGGDELGAGVDRVVLDDASPVRSASGVSVATTASDETRSSVTREPGPYDVAVKSDNVVVVGDTDLFRPLNYNRADNEVLIGNMLEFLSGGPSDPYSPPEEASGEGPTSPDGQPPGGEESPEPPQ